MLIIGLTGGIGSGKTTACNQFMSLGVPIIDADLVARDVVKPGQPGLEQIVATFGPKILAADGTLERGQLREKIFSDSSARQKLEAILHPLIRAEIKNRLSAIEATYVIMAIPLLIESGQYEIVDRILVIDVPEKQQIERICLRDGMDAEQAKHILTVQCSRSDRIAVANDVIYNTGDLEQLKSEVTKLHNFYLQLATQSN